MPVLKFDKRSIDAIPFTKEGGSQVDYFDSATAGLGIRVGAKTKTFFVKADVKDPTKPKGYKTVKKTLGRYGDITLEQARLMMNGRIDKAGDIVPGARLELKQATSEDTGTTVTLRQLMEECFKERKRKDGKERKEGTITGYRRSMEFHFEAWLDITLADIAKFTPDVIIARHEQIKANRGAYAARDAFTVMMLVVNYGLIKYPAVLTRNPFTVLTKNQILAVVRQREEKLDGNEFKQFYAGLQKFNDTTRDALLITLYHGMRNIEVTCLKWEHVDLEKKTICIPDTKNRRALHVPMSKQSYTILKRRQELAGQDNSFVFPAVSSQSTTGHVALHPNTLRLATGLDITIHALRRTFITVGRRLKMFNDTDRLTNHIDSTVTGKHYDGTDIDDLRQPLQVIDNEIERLMLHGVGAKVIPFAVAQAE